MAILSVASKANPTLLLLPSSLQPCCFHCPATTLLSLQRCRIHRTTSGGIDIITIMAIVSYAIFQWPCDGPTKKTSFVQKLDGQAAVFFKTPTEMRYWIFMWAWFLRTICTILSWLPKCRRPVRILPNQLNSQFTYTSSLSEYPIATNYIPESQRIQISD